MTDCRLSRLNTDTLYHLFQHVKSGSIQDLQSLSSTSHHLRAASMSVLFNACYQRLHPPSTNGRPHDVLPPTLWPYVRKLAVCCLCPSRAVPSSVPGVYNHLVCTAFCGRIVDVVLPALSDLTTLRLETTCLSMHGLPWPAMRTALSLPTLRHLEIDRFYVCPVLSDNISYNFAAAPLTTLRYIMSHYRQPLSFASELATLHFVIRNAHTSLRILVLPAECAPIQTMSSLPWPHLRELTLRGERWTDPSIPIVSLFSSMSSLRFLALELSEPKKPTIGARVVWPKGFSATFPWPDLESLRISHPDPADELYAHLPSSLHTLALRPWPHRCLRFFPAIHIPLSSNVLSAQAPASSHRWSSFPITPARDLIRIVRKCDLPQLRTLELEYASDAEEPRLLRLAVLKFPNLTALEIHRFRSEGSGDVRAIDLANALAPLASLHTLKLYVDFAAPDGPQSATLVGLATPAVDAVAGELARRLSPSLRVIWLLQDGKLWCIFRVSRAEFGGQTHVQATYDSGTLLERC